MSRLASRIVVTAALVAASLVPAGAAHAATLAPSQVVVAGTGFIVPGLPCSNCNVQYDFTAVTAGGITGVFTGCVLTATTNGQSSELIDAGSGAIGGCGITGTVSWTRNLAVETWGGIVSVLGICHVIVLSALAWVPTNVLPVTTFAMAGTLTLTPC